MRDLAYQLSRGFAFWGIKHPGLSLALRWLPVALAVVSAAVFASLSMKPPLVGDGGMSRHLIAVFSTLPGFFIAALAAVSTFSSVEMDMTMPHPAPRIRLKFGNEKEWVEMTFRMFLSHLFGYLTTLSLLAVFAFVMVDLLNKSGGDVLAHISRQEVAVWIGETSKIAYVALATWLSSTVVLTTLLGIYFLAERVHRPNA